MTYVVTDACIRCKYMDCVEVCPVDCFYEGENMLVINPNECIDCGVCEPECPAEAILPDTESGLEKWLELNTTFSAQWPNLTRKGEQPADAVLGVHHIIADNEAQRLGSHQLRPFLWKMPTRPARSTSHIWEASPAAASDDKYRASRTEMRLNAHLTHAL